jgi:hypothetical protein
MVNFKAATRGRAADPADENLAFLNPDTAVAGGLRNDFEGTIVAARYEEWDFKGKAKPVTQRNRTLSGHKMALHLTLDDIDDGSAAPTPEEVWWPAGAIEDFVPSDDGLSFEAVTGLKGFSRDSEIIQGMEAVIATKAIEKSELGIDPSVLEGLRFYWHREPAKWAKPQEGKTAPDNLMPQKYIATGKAGGNGKAQGAKAKPASTASKQTAASGGGAGDEILEQAIKLCGEVLSDLPPKQETISREELGSEVIALILQKYRKDIDKDTRNAIGELFENDAFLDQNAGRKTWSYNSESGEVTPR